MGYVIVDHSASLPSIQRQYGKIKEYDTVQCRHCTGAIKVEKRQHTGLWCQKCAGPVHDNKECGSRCLPYQKEMDKFLDAIRKRLSREKFIETLGI